MSNIPNDPSNDGLRDDFIDDQVDRLLNCDDATGVEFDQFAEALNDSIANLDSSYSVVQLVLACRRGDMDLAQNIGTRLAMYAQELAEEFIKGTLKP